MAPSPSLCWGVQGCLLGLQTDAPASPPSLPAFRPLQKLGLLRLESLLVPGITCPCQAG